MDSLANSSLFMAVAHGQLNKLKAVLESNEDSEFVNSIFVDVNQYGQNIFHLAATSSCDYDTFIYLLQFASNDPVKLKSNLLIKDNKGNTPLIAAAYNKQLNKLKAVLDSNIDSDFVDSVFNNVNQYGRNIFHVAATNSCDYDTFIYLLKLRSNDSIKLKSNLLKKDNNGNTPLIAAAYNGQLNKLKAVLDSNTDSEFIDSVFVKVNQNGENIFHLATTNSCDYDTFIYLLKFASSDPVKLKSNLLQTDNSGQTPLIVAAIYGQLNKLKVILESNMDSEFVDSVFDNINQHDQNIFHLTATSTCDYETFIYLLQLANSDPVKLKSNLLKKDDNGNTPLIVTTYNGQLNKLKAVLDSNIDSEFVDSVFNNVNQYGQNIFHLASISSCDYETFIYLLKFLSNDPVKFKYNLLKTDNSGETPLTIAAAYGQLNKLKAVLESDLLIDSKFVNSIFVDVNQYGQNIFHRAATSSCDYDTFIYLLQFASNDPVKLKSNLLKKDNNGNTPLTAAAYNGQLNKLKAVLDSNIDSEFINSVFVKVNQNGENIFHLAITNSCDYDTFIYLLKFASSDPVKLNNYLLKKNKSGDTPLAVAGRIINLDKLKILLELDTSSEIVDIIFQEL